MLSLFSWADQTIAQGVRVERVFGEPVLGDVKAVKDGKLEVRPFSGGDDVQVSMTDLILVEPSSERFVPMTEASVVKVKLRKGQHRFSLGYWNGEAKPKLDLKYGLDGDLNPVRQPLLYRVPPQNKTLVRFFQGRKAPTETADEWRKPGFDDSKWEEGAMPLGYGEDSVKFETTLGSMRNNYRGVFVRQRFVIDDPEKIASVVLKGRCDDGYIAWINGAEVDRYNMEKGELPYDVKAERSPEPIPFLHRKLKGSLKHLVKGTNVIAFHVANTSKSSSDLLLNLTLLVEEKGGRDKDGYRLPENAVPLENHFNFTWYEGAKVVKNWAHLLKAKVARRGVSNDFDRTIRGMTNGSAIVFSGYLKIPEDGEYTFDLKCNGVSQMMFDHVAAAEEGAAGSGGGGEKIAEPDVRLSLKGDIELRGAVQSWTETELVLAGGFEGQALELTVPVDQLEEVEWVKEGEDEAPEIREAPLVQDVVYVKVGEDLQKVPGLVKGVVDGSLLFRFKERDRKIKLDKVVKLRLARDLAPDSALNRFYQVIELSSGEKVYGNWTSHKKDNLEWRTLWGGDLKLPWSDLVAIQSINGRLRYVADLKPVLVKEVPFFDRVPAFRVNKTVTGGEVEMAGAGEGKEFRRSLNMHSWTELTYELKGAYERFQSTVGFQNTEERLGNVDLRVVGDGKVLFEKKNYAASSTPEEVDVAVAGVTELTLVVGFGEGQDVGDQVVWGDARLVKREGE